MLIVLKQLILPDYCSSCGEIGDILCENCKSDIIAEVSNICPSCRSPQPRSGECGRCVLPYSHAWYVGDHRGSLDKLVSASKFGSNRAGCDAQAELLDRILPRLPDNTVVVPVPTIARHIRERGYGHAERIARTLARRRGVSSIECIGRKTQYIQHGSSRSDRKRQAANSYFVNLNIDPAATYLLVDDVYTTGFTMHYVAQALRDAGASDVWIAVTSRQPIDDKE